MYNYGEHSLVQYNKLLHIMYTKQNILYYKQAVVTVYCRNNEDL